MNTPRELTAEEYVEFTEAWRNKFGNLPDAVVWMLQEKGVPREVMSVVISRYAPDAVMEALRSRIGL